VGVVRVVHDHLEGVLVEDVQAARRLEETGREGAQAVLDVLAADLQAIGERGREHRVLHVVHGATLDGRRDQVRPHQRQVAARS
jgi:hypothetical protein